MTLKAILFDLGGTLIHYHDPQADNLKHPFRRVTVLGIRAVMEHLAPKGFTPSQIEQLTGTIGRHIDQSYRAMWIERRGGCIEASIQAGLSEIDMIVDEASWTAARHHLYHPVDQTVSARKGIRATLDALRDKGYRLGVISNTFWAADLHDRHLAEHGLLDFFPVRVYSSETPYQKPHPSIFLTALEQMGIRAEEAVYVGDRIDVDVAGAQQVGMRGILIRSPYLPADLDGHVPDAIIEELPDLIPALADLSTAAVLSMDKTEG
ncbi:MAG: HAD family hydrolase [Anaerolineae bacterium]|nr:HAD family hydrolase [Anaerolineae bacterium]